MKPAPQAEDFCPWWHPALNGLLCLALLFAPVPIASAAKSDAILVHLADGFDYPVGKPNADGYYKYRGFYPNGHLGEDWNGRGGGNSDMGDPIYSMGRGIVVQSENVARGWGNVIIIRHAFRDNDGAVRVVDSLYGHLKERKVKLYEKVDRGQLVGTMGNNNGMYYAHLHFEVRKNLQIGMNRSKFKGDYSNYHSPTTFIKGRRKLTTSFRRYKVPINTFAPYDKAAASRRPPPPPTPESVKIPLVSHLKRSERKAPPVPKAPRVDPALARALSDTSTDVEVGNDDGFFKKLRANLSRAKASSRKKGGPMSRRR